LSVVHSGLLQGEIRDRSSLERAASLRAAPPEGCRRFRRA
jgi:hypothetical protein